MPLDITHGYIEMAHGSGGRATAELVDELFLPAFDNHYLRQRNDQALMLMPSKRVVMATDSHVVSPLFFPGGDIGCLSVYGTVNDVVMSGAVPLYLSAGFILEEGLPLADLQRIVQSMATAAQACGVSIVTGDTKVVERGHGDGVYINTTGIGVVDKHLNLSPMQIRAGDRILVSGTLGDHGAAIMTARQGFNLNTELHSDAQPLHDLVAAMVQAVPDIRCMRDLTRGGLAAIVHELLQGLPLGMVLSESSFPVQPGVQAVAEILGLDPVNMANEGCLVAVCPAHSADTLLAVMRDHPKARQAAIIGEVVADADGFVQLNTAFGGRRIMDWRYADPLPRIC